MEGITLLIAVVALIISILAYQRTGGTTELKRQIETGASSPETEETDRHFGRDDRFLERKNSRCAGSFRKGHSENR